MGADGAAKDFGWRLPRITQDGRSKRFAATAARPAEAGLMKFSLFKTPEHPARF